LTPQPLAICALSGESQRLDKKLAKLVAHKKILLTEPVRLFLCGVR
jgi:hypothetical protein